ncbi:RNA polymerase sigma factor [Ascidiimonas sp. W6]|uniref:RNA polymerase sigma factor n=1 Tax=Ascidiimonas meishanensis TaxID=3128903 RepID=UPI0030EDF387
MDKNRDIFISILENHKGIIFKIVNSYCKEVEDRQDLIQEIIIQLWISFHKYNNQFKLSTWIYRIALNTSISFYRKNKVRNEKTVSVSPFLETTLKEDEPLQENSDFLKLQAFIQDLKEVDKALILLYLDGLTQKEIAKIIGITPTNVGTKIERIKKSLKEKFKKQ